ncbi:hypothetical protein COL940_013969 [Colletotrichum noveboracense]|nr:hypothetical protein COL940_013969 [Colletotrichum noveboracense]KAJ0270847.1 hypothetical protein CBS470a_013377 [Colletotrichum nupharicola]
MSSDCPPPSARIMKKKARLTTPVTPIKSAPPSIQTGDVPTCPATGSKAMLDELPKKETRGSTATEYHALYNEIAEFYMHLLELQLARDQKNKEGPALIPGPMLNAWKKIDNQLTSAFESTVEISAISKEIHGCQERIAEYMSLAKFPKSGKMDFRVLLLLLLTKWQIGAIRRASTADKHGAGVESIRGDEGPLGADLEVQFDRLQVVNVNDAELDVYRNDTGNKQIMDDDST